MGDNARERLVGVLDRRAFDPVLKASPDDYRSEAERRKLADVQKTTESTQRSYHERYESAEKVRQMFHDDLSSDAAQRVQDEIRSLGLPTLQDAKDEFEKVADEVGVGS